MPFCSSDDDDSFQIVSPARPAPVSSAYGTAQTNVASTSSFPGHGRSLASASASASASAPLRPSYTSARENGPPKPLPQVIEIDDSDDEGEVHVQPARVDPARPLTRTVSAPMPSSDDLPAFVPRRSESTGASKVAPRPAKPSVLLTALNEYNSSNPRVSPEPAAVQEKGKRKGKQIVCASDEEDPYDAMVQRGGKQVSRKKRPRTADSIANGSDANNSHKAKKKAPTLSQEDKDAKQQRAADERAAKAAGKARDAEEKAKMRKANVLKTQRKETVSELTVHVAGTAFRASSPEADDSGSGRKGKGKKPESAWVRITDQLREKMGEYGCVVDVPDGRSHDLGAEGTMRWVRLCDREWDDERQKFFPLSDGHEKLVEEDTRLVYIDALELSTLVADGHLLAHVSTLKSRIPPHVHLILMVMGLKKVFRQMENAENAAYTEDVRRQLGDDTGAARARVVGIGPRQPGKETIDLDLMRVQVATKCYIVQVEKDDEAIDWLEQLTMDVGQKPYARHKQLQTLELGTTDDKVVSGTDLLDTYRKMLATLKGITDPVAKCITRDYPTIWSLYEGWAACADEAQAKMMLVGLQKQNNVNGAATNRTLGKATSETIWRVFNSTDPDMFMSTT